MTPLTLLAVAWQGVRRRPLRNALTSVSLLVGVLTIVLIEGASTTMNQAIVMDSVLDRGPATTMRVAVAEAALDPVQTADDWKRSLTAVTSDVPSRTAVVIDQPATAVWVGGRPASDLTVQAVDPDIHGIRPFPVLTGAWFGPSTLAPQIVLNKAGWDTVGEAEGRIEVAAQDGSDRVTARVVGVIHDGNRAPNAYLNLADDGRWRSAAYRTGSVAVLVQSPSLDERTLHARVSGLASVSGRTGEIGEINRVDRIDDYDAQLGTSRRVFLAIAALSLLVGSLGILNVGLATLRERSDELSLRRSFGATRAHVVLIMMLESQIVAVGAAALAIALATAGAPLVFARIGPEYSFMSVGVPFSAVAIGLAASSLAALAGAVAPTVRAAKVPIASIMR